MTPNNGPAHRVGTRGIESLATLDMIRRVLVYRHISERLTPREMLARRREAS